jgi:hypothetical protein
LQDIYKSTYGIIFLGTPHRGSKYVPWGILANNLAAVCLRKPNQRMLRDMEVNSSMLDVIADAFSNMIKKNEIKIHSFYEEKGMSGFRAFSGKVSMQRLQSLSMNKNEFMN